MDNVYLELELFLDPPITDAAALTDELNKKISEWHKAFATNPLLKHKVSQAKQLIKNGFGNLPQQAKQACEQKRDELQEQIRFRNIFGSIDEAGIKELVNLFKKFFTETTIKEAATSGGTEVSSPPVQYQPPQEPASLKSSKPPVSYSDMKTIAKDLRLVKNGQCGNLYKLLELPHTASLQELSARAKEFNDKVLKMPKSNSEADPLNRLAGKCLFYFKEETHKKSYDAALKRYPFEGICENKLNIFAKGFVKTGDTRWGLYQESIQDAVKLGYSADEAEYLVYDFYCNKRKCPLPIPSNEPLPPGNQEEPEEPKERIIEKIKKIMVSAGEAVKNVINKITAVGKDVITQLRKPPEQTVIHRTETQFTNPQEDAVKKTLAAVRKNFNPHTQYTVSTVSYLNGLFEQLDDLYLRKADLSSKTVEELSILRGEVGEALGDLDYNAQYFSRALLG
ncbi:MAG: hypothetical protein LBT89_10720, partial [Planctomycetaceae bacterium]|nr:hypothetical protein [Planctomycetaceae bacterium]